MQLKPMKIKKNTTNSLSDRTTSFANLVIKGEIIAGTTIKNGCIRHLDDLKNGADRGLHFDVNAAQHAMDFFSQILYLNGGEYEGQPYNLFHWQQFIVGNLFGWKGTDGFRRFRMAYIETAKGSGKSPLIAGIGLYGLLADNEPRAEVYSAAAKKDQAMVLFRDAVSMVDQSEILREEVGKSGRGTSVWNLSHIPSGSFFRPISADDGQSGPRPHIALLDEVHEHKNDYMVEILRAGTKSRRQALIAMITNSGFDRQSVCWRYHDYSLKINARQLEDDSFFGFVCSIDEGDNPLLNEDCWYKSNPSLMYGLPPLKYLREQVTQARGMPAKESLVRRLNFCEWVGASNPWISSEAWFAIADNSFCLDDHLGRRCWGGLDLASVQDLTSLALLFEPTEVDPLWRLVNYFWLPDDDLMNKSSKDGVHYEVWRDGGHLRTTHGKALDKLAVARECSAISHKFDLQFIAYDRWRIEEFKALLDREGINLPLVEFGQGFQSMSPAIDSLETMIVNKEIFHDGNPLMTWNAANAILVSDPAGNKKVAKNKSTGRMDGIVAAIMAVGARNMVVEPVMMVGIDVFA